MSKVIVSLSFIFFILCIAGSVESSYGRRSRSMAYIEASCRKTGYPDLCLRCLSGFSNTSVENPEQLAQIALSVSLYRAMHTRAYIKKVARELQKSKATQYLVIKDCLEQINDSVDQLSQSIKELRRMSQVAESDLTWHTSNVETWVSAALTDASTCLDQFHAHQMSKVRATIKAKVLNLAQVTSNALALFHHYAAKHRATIKP